MRPDKEKKPKPIDEGRERQREQEERRRKDPHRDAKAGRYDGVRAKDDVKPPPDND